MYKVNISIDDVTPHPHSSVGCLDRCFELIEVFPDIKFTLFVPMAYYRTMPLPKESLCETPLYLNHFPDFCQTLFDLSEKNFEIAYHGFFHGIPGVSNNDEFRDLNYDEAILKFQKMFDVSREVSLYQKMKMIIRPPAWRMSSQSISAARDVGFRVLALNSDSNYMKFYGDCVDNLDDVLYATCYPPYKSLELSKNTEIVYHACEWDANYLDERKCLELIEFIDGIREKYSFCFMEDMI